MATSLADIRARLQQQETKQGGNSSGGGDNAIFAHWNIKEGDTATIRFLPDGNSKNDFFWVERAMIRLPFQGIKGQADSKPVQVQVPCVEMWGETCPILSEVRTWFKDKSLEDMGRKYWKKRSYLFQGFVRDNPMQEDATPENPIRRFVISPQIFNLIKSALLDPDMVELPTDYNQGLDFRVVKTSKGGYSDYSTSNWARRESALTSTETAAIEQYGLFDLADFLPKRPDETTLKVMKEMFEASVDGQPYDADKWGSYFRPAGVVIANAQPATESAPAPSTPKPTVDGHGDVHEPVEEEDDAEPAEATAPVETAKPASQRAEDILAMIRNRQK